MKAYMVNQFYIFTDYNELTTLLYDVLHHTNPESGKDGHIFSISTGRLLWDEMLFIDTRGESVELYFDPIDQIFYPKSHDLIEVS